MKLVNINKLLVTILCAAGLSLAAGCATLEGAGEDIESAGESVQDAADGE
jgi:predicted small secreted protein